MNTVPSGPIGWSFAITASDTDCPQDVVKVLAQTWYYARQEACKRWTARLGRVISPDDIECVGRDDDAMRTEGVRRPPLIYIAGPFSAPDRSGVERNIGRAEAWALRVAELGGMPVCSHTNTSHPDFESVQQYPFWIAGTMALLEVCDAILLISGWEESRGAKGEAVRAHELMMPAFIGTGGLEELKKWIEGG